MGFPLWVIANLKMFFRDRGTLFWALLFPIIFMGLLGLGFGRTDPVEFKVGVVDEDDSVWSERLWSTLSNDTLPFVVTNFTERDATSAAVEAGDLDVALVIPAGFGAFMANQTGGNASETLSLPAWYGVNELGSGPVALQAIQEVTDGFFRFWTLSPPKLDVAGEALAAQNLQYIDYLAPGILSMAIMQSGVYGLALFIVSSREKRILKRLHATPAGAAYILAGRIVPALLISFIQTALLLTLAVVAFGVNIVGNVGVLVVAAGFGAVVFISLGFLVSSVSRSADSAENLTGLITFPMFFLGGVFIPIERLPESVQVLAYSMPLTYFSDALRQVMIHGAGFGGIAVDLGVLAAFALAVFALAVKLFRWE
jgi:ABC-2 type transport system permease protein